VESIRLEKIEKDSEAHRTVNRVDDGGHVATVSDESVMAQLIGVAILEFGVILHRFVKPSSIYGSPREVERTLCCSVLIGLTLAVDEGFKVLFVVVVFHRTYMFF